MDEFKKFVDTLNLEEAIKMRQSLEAADDWQEMPQKELVDKMIANVLWDYKVSSEHAKNPAEARKYDSRRAELYAKWKELGFVK